MWNKRPIECILIALVAGIIGGALLNQQDNKPTQEQSAKTPKGYRQTHASNEVAMIKLAFDTGYRACLCDVLDMALEAEGKNDTEDYTKLLNFLHAKAEKVTK